jgi:hypothetical protein
MSDDWRNEFATEEQKEKLRFFGCTWCGDITMGKASDALEECAKQFPGIEAAYKNRPITDDQLDELRSLGQEPVREFTYGEAMELIESIKTRNAKRREDAAAIFQNETNAKVETSLHPDAPQIAGENLPPIIDRYPLERGRSLKARVAAFAFKKLVCPKNFCVFLTKTPKTCTRLVTQNKFLGFFEMPRDNT